MQKKTRLTTSLAAASIALIALAGCTSTKPDDAAKDGKPTANAEQSSDKKSNDEQSANATEDEVFVPEEKTYECVDGVVSIPESNAILTLEGDCASVEVTGVNSLISITGSVDQLSVGGSINKVVTVSANNITFVEESSGNVVESQGEPVVTDNGAENEVIAPE
ncbi:hypothetical protein [Leucobacter musarum]|uniref:hypothetical protein n=1 Tax=Leucobacter musarum TaxID=1930747 RepID=UPI000AA948B8|nr:hypothetical protein [Leucobacter musarum]